MKILRTCFALLLIAFLCSTIKAQTYRPFPQDSAGWDVYSVLFWDPVYLEDGTHHLNVNGDTILGGITWRKVYRSDSASWFDPTQTLRFFYREDSMRIYLKYPESQSWETISDTTPFLAFDFSLNVGDTLHTRYWTMNQNLSFDKLVVDNVDSVLLNDGYHRRLRLLWVESTHPVPLAFCYDTYLYHIEGVGTYQGPEINYRMAYCFCFDCFATMSLSCFHDHFQYIYGGTGCHFMPGFEENGADVLSMYPNPSNSWITLEFRQPIGEGHAVLYDMSGKECMSFQLSGSRQDFEVWDLPSGIYNLKLEIDGRGTFRRVEVAR